MEREKEAIVQKRWRKLYTWWIRPRPDHRCRGRDRHGREWHGLVTAPTHVRDATVHSRGIKLVGHAT